MPSRVGALGGFPGSGEFAQPNPGSLVSRSLFPHPAPWEQRWSCPEPPGPPRPAEGTFPAHTSLLAIYSQHRAAGASAPREPGGGKGSPPPHPEGGSCLPRARDEPWGGCSPGCSCGRRGHSRDRQGGRQGGRVTSLAVTEFTARHGKIPTKPSSPPLLHPDAEFWHPPGWQPLGTAALAVVPAPGEGAVPTHGRTAAPGGCRCQDPQLPGALAALSWAVPSPEQAEITQGSSPNTGLFCCYHPHALPGKPRA